MTDSPFYVRIREGKVYLHGENPDSTPQPVIICRNGERLRTSDHLRAGPNSIYTIEGARLLLSDQPYSVRIMEDDGQRIEA